MNPLQRAFTDLPQDDWHGELTAAELGPVAFEWDPNGKGRWVRPGPAADYATYSDGTPPDPAHENAGDRAERKTRELLAKSHITELRAGPPGYFEMSMSGRLPPKPANTPEPDDVAHGLLDTIGLWAAYATALCVVGCVVFLFS